MENACIHGVDTYISEERRGETRIHEYIGIALGIHTQPLAAAASGLAERWLRRRIEILNKQTSFLVPFFAIPERLSHSRLRPQLPDEAAPESRTRKKNEKKEREKKTDGFDRTQNVFVYELAN